MSAGTARPSFSSPWRGGMLSALLVGLVISAGCRGCGADKAAKKKARKAVVKKEQKPPGPSVGDMISSQGPRGELKALEMRAPTAPETTREVAPEVAAARDLIVSGDKAKAADARTQLTEFLKTHETDADAHYWMGRAWMLERIAVPSIEQFDLAIQHDASFMEPYKWAAVAMHREKRCADGMMYLDKVVQMQPEDGNALVDRAVCHLALDDWPKAIADLEAYCAKNAEEAFCPSVAKVKAQLGRTGAAKQPPLKTAEERKAYREANPDGGKRGTEDFRKRTQRKKKSE